MIAPRPQVFEQQHSQLDARLASSSAAISPSLALLLSRGYRRASCGARCVLMGKCRQGGMGAGGAHGTGGGRREQHSMRACFCIRHVARPDWSPGVDGAGRQVELRGGGERRAADVSTRLVRERSCVVFTSARAAFEFRSQRPVVPPRRVHSPQVPEPWAPPSPASSTLGSGGSAPWAPRARTSPPWRRCRRLSRVLRCNTDLALGPRCLAGLLQPISRTGWFFSARAD